MGICKCNDHGEACDGMSLFGSKVKVGFKPSNMEGAVADIHFHELDVLSVTEVSHCQVTCLKSGTGRRMTSKVCV